MRAVQITRLDGPSAVEVTDVPEPTAGTHVLIDIHAAGVTFPDVLQTRGQYQIKMPTPFVPGAEVAGVVRSAPEGSGFSEGDRVAAFPGFGGYAETVAVDPAQVFPLPDRFSFEQGAAVPMNLLTVHFALKRRARLETGETVLVHGAGGGVGTAATQLAKALGAEVIGVTSDGAKADLARRAGADEIAPADGFLVAANKITDHRGVDVVVDPVGGTRFTDSLRSLSREGRLLVIGFTGGEIPTVKVNRLLLHNTSVVGVGWGEFWLANRGYLQEQWRDLMPLMEAGALDPIIGSSYPLDEAAQALASMENRTAVGKLVLTVR